MPETEPLIQYISKSADETALHSLNASQRVDWARNWLLTEAKRQSRGGRNSALYAVLTGYGFESWLDEVVTGWNPKRGRLVQRLLYMVQHRGRDEVERTIDGSEFGDMAVSGGEAADSMDEGATTDDSGDAPAGDLEHHSNPALYGFAEIMDWGKAWHLLEWEYTERLSHWLTDPDPTNRAWLQGRRPHVAPLKEDTFKRSKRTRSDRATRRPCFRKSLRIRPMLEYQMMLAAHGYPDVTPAVSMRSFSDRALLLPPSDAQLKKQYPKGWAEQSTAVETPPHGWRNAWGLYRVAPSDGPRWWGKPSPNRGWPMHSPLAGSGAWWDLADRLAKAKRRHADAIAGLALIEHDGAGWAPPSSADVYEDLRPVIESSAPWHVYIPLGPDAPEEMAGPRSFDPSWPAAWCLAFPSGKQVYDVELWKPPAWMRGSGIKAKGKPRRVPKDIEKAYQPKQGNTVSRSAIWWKEKSVGGL